MQLLKKFSFLAFLGEEGYFWKFSIPIQKKHETISFAHESSEAHFIHTLFVRKTNGFMFLGSDAKGRISGIFRRRGEFLEGTYCLPIDIKCEF